MNSVIIDGYKFTPAKSGVYKVMTLSGIVGECYWDPRWGGCWKDFTSTNSNKHPYYREDHVIRWFYDEEGLYE